MVLINNGLQVGTEFHIAYRASYSTSSEISNLSIAEAVENAHHGHYGLAHVLLNYYGRIKPSLRPVPRVKPEAHNTAYRARGTMKKHFTEMGQKQLIYVPGQQTKKYMRTKTM